MTENNNELLIALSEMIDKKLDTKLEPITNHLDALDNKVSALDNRVSALDNKLDATKEDLINRMNEMEQGILNTCLAYTDEQDEKIITRLDDIQHKVDTIYRLKTIDHDMLELGNKRMDNMQKEIDYLKQKIS